MYLGVIRRKYLHVKFSFCSFLFSLIKNNLNRMKKYGRSLLIDMGSNHGKDRNRSVYGCT